MVKPGKLDNITLFQYYTRQCYTRKIGSSSAEHFFWLVAHFFFDIWDKPSVSTISAENHRKTACFPARPRFFIEATRKNPRWTNGTPIESAAWN